MSTTAEITQERLALRKSIISKQLKEHRKTSHDLVAEVTEICSNLDQLPSDGENFSQEFTGMSAAKVKKEVEEENNEELYTDFERKTRQFMERILGKPGKVRGTRSRKNKFALFDSGGNVDAQIDNVGMFTWEDESQEQHAILFVVENKFTQDKNGHYGGSSTALRAAINKHSTTIAKLRKEIDAVRSGRGAHVKNKESLNDYAAVSKQNLEYVGVFALSGIKLTSQERKLIKSKGFKKWDDDFIKYYDQLSKKIQHYALYDMLGDHDMQIQNPDRDPPMAFCLRSIMKIGSVKMPVYQFLMDPKKLLKIATVARRDRPMEKFYQRQIENSRLLEIARFLNRGNIAPNNIIIGMEKKMHSKAKFSVVKFKKYGGTGKPPAYYIVNKQQQASSLPVEVGTLTFPREYRSCWIIDGQHRLYAIVKTENQGGRETAILKRDVKLPIVAFGGIDQLAMADMFLTINDKQKKINSNLKFDLYAEYKAESLQGIQAKIVKDLDTGSSPLEDRISYPSEQEPKKHDKKERTSISAMYDAVNSSKLAQPILIPKGQGTAKPKNPIPNPLQKGWSFEYWKSEARRKKVIRDVPKLIGQWYTVLDKEFEETANKGKDGILYQQQTCKLWLPLLREIVAHETKWPSSSRLTKYAEALKSWVKENSTNKNVKDAAAHYDSAKRMLQKMAEQIRKAADKKLKTFGDKTGLLTADEDVVFLEMLFGFYIQGNVTDWEKILDGRSKKEIKKKAYEESKENWECLDMGHIQKIMVDYTDRSGNRTNLEDLAEDFSDQDEYSGTNTQENTQKAAKGIASIVLGEHLYKISVITHGNGPQVGNLLLQQEFAKNVPRLPMHAAVAMTQGQIGYMLQQALQNEFKKLKKDKKIVSLITQTVVSKNDPKLVQPFPSKPIGPYFTELEAKKLRSSTNQIFKKVKPNGVKTWRMVVPSPKPLEIVELDILKELAEDSCLLIAAGGGGIPVIKNGSGFEGVDCVIDKDRSASLLAKSIKASVLLLLTDIDKVKLNYGKSDESDLDVITVKDAKKFLKEEQFLEGSMEPKIQASIDFLESGGDVAIITSFDHALAALNGKAGTRIISKN